MSDNPRLYLTNSNGDRVTELVDYASVVYHQPYNAVGKWSMTVPRDIGAAIAKGWGLELQLPSGDLLTGKIVSVDVKPGSTQALVKGLTDLYMVAARLALPEPSGAFSSQDYDVRTGALETVVKGYVRDNASQDALIAERAWPFEVDGDLLRGATVTGRARFHNLLWLVRDLIAAAGDDYRLVLSAGVFDIEPVTDRTSAPMFADWMSGVEYGYSWQAPAADYIYAGGQGVGTARLIEERYNPAELMDYWRIEEFYDYRNAADASELRQRADAKLARSSAKEGCKLRVSGQLRYGDQYKEGDYVTVQIGGTAFNARVEGVVLRYSAGKGWTEEVGVGVNAMEVPFDAFRQSDITARVRNLEVI